MAYAKGADQHSYIPPSFQAHTALLIELVIDLFDSIGGGGDLVVSGFAWWH